MPVKGGTKCIKYLLFGFNFIFWVRRPGPCPPRCPGESPRDGDRDGGEGKRRAGSRVLFAFLVRGFCRFPHLLPPGRRGAGARVLTALFFTFFEFSRKAGRVCCRAGRRCWFLRVASPRPLVLHTVLALKLCVQVGLPGGFLSAGAVSGVSRLVPRKSQPVIVVCANSSCCWELWLPFEFNLSEQTSPS